MTTSPASSRALAAVLPLIASQPYEAHQKARTFASRYVKARQFDTAIDVLFQSARELFKAGQIGSGMDLSSFLLDVYTTKEEPVTEESRGEGAVKTSISRRSALSSRSGRITQLIALVGSSGTWRKAIIDKAITSVRVLVGSQHWHRLT